MDEAISILRQRKVTSDQIHETMDEVNAPLHRSHALAKAYLHVHG
jgi:hypothetical protein